jgi:hypothetical protein
VEEMVADAITAIRGNHAAIAKLWEGNFFNLLNIGKEK